MQTVSWTAWRFFRFSLLWLALSAMWTSLLSIVLPAMADQFARGDSTGWGRGAYLGLFAGVGATVSALTQVLVGWRSDRERSRWRRWKFLLGGFLLTVFPLLMVAHSRRPGELLASLVLLQLTANMATGPYQALIPDEVPPQRHGLASTWMGLFQHAGQVAGPLLAGWLLSQNLSGLPRLHLLLYAGIVVGLSALWSALPPGQVSEAPPEPGQAASLRQGVSNALAGNRNFRLVLTSRLVINIGFYLVVNFLLFYVQYALGFENATEMTGTLLVCMVLGGLLGGLAIGPLADRVRKLHLIYLTCALTGLGMVGFCASPSGRALPACLFALLAGLGFGGFSVVDWSLACNLAPRATSALAMGIWNLAAVVPQVIAPGVFGPLSDRAVLAFGPALAYRGVMGAVILFLGLGCYGLRTLREDQPGLSAQAGSNVGNE
jgi:MFS family permease